MFVTLTDSLLWTCNSFLQARIGHIDSTVSVMCSHYSTLQEIIHGNQWPQICPIEKLQPSMQPRVMIEVCAYWCLWCECYLQMLYSSCEESATGMQLQMQFCMIYWKRVDRRVYICTIALEFASIAILCFFLSSWRLSTPSLQQNNRTTSSLSSTWGTTSGPCRTWAIAKFLNRL